MVVSYTVKGDVFIADRPRPWSEKRLAEYSGRNFDIAPDGRVIAMLPSETPGDTRAQNHAIFLENFADGVQRRIGPPK